MDPGVRRGTGVNSGLYLHVPYCSVRCSYCDFYLVASGRPDTRRFVSALGAEIAASGAGLPDRVVDTIHFGGGTPSILPPADLESILTAIRRSFRVSDGAELALEANPEDIDPQRLDRLAAIGFNRIAIGVQSLDDRRLRRRRRRQLAGQPVAGRHRLADARLRRGCREVRRVPQRCLGAEHGR